MSDLQSLLERLKGATGPDLSGWPNFAEEARRARREAVIARSLADQWRREADRLESVAASLQALIASKSPSETDNENLG